MLVSKTHCGTFVNSFPLIKSPRNVGFSTVPGPEASEASTYQFCRDVFSLFSMTDVPWGCKDCCLENKLLLSWFIKIIKFCQDKIRTPLRTKIMNTYCIEGNFHKLLKGNIKISVLENHLPKDAKSITDQLQVCFVI